MECTLTNCHGFSNETTHLEFHTSYNESQMNETTQTQINLGDYNKPQEQTKAIGIGKILGKIINIKAFKTNRGKPSPYTPKEMIGEDGLTDYNVIDTLETFDVNNQKVSLFCNTRNSEADSKSSKLSIRTGSRESIWTL